MLEINTFFAAVTMLSVAIEAITEVIRKKMPARTMGEDNVELMMYLIHFIVGIFFVLNDIYAEFLDVNDVFNKVISAIGFAVGPSLLNKLIRK